MDLTSKALVKISPAANRDRTVVVVGLHQGRLYIEGLARRSNYGDYGTVTVTLSVPEPGTIILFQESTDPASEGKELFLYEHGFRVLNQHSLWHALRDPGLIKSTIENLCASLINKFPDKGLLGDPEHTIQWTLHRLIEMMSSARHGGLIVILPNEDNEFKKGPVYLVHHEHRNLFRDGLSTFMGVQRDYQKLLWDSVGRGPSRTMTEDEEFDVAIAKSENDYFRNALESTIELIAGLTTIDNALLLGPNLTFLGAGYAIPTQSDDELPAVSQARDLHGEDLEDYSMDQHGSRHRAAVWCAHQNPGGLVFIVSQDGPLRCFLRPVGQDNVLVWLLRIPGI